MFRGPLAAAVAHVTVVGPALRCDGSASNPCVWFLAILRCSVVSFPCWPSNGTKAGTPVWVRNEMSTVASFVPLLVSRTRVLNPPPNGKWAMVYVWESVVELAAGACVASALFEDGPDGLWFVGRRLSRQNSH